MTDQRGGGVSGLGARERRGQGAGHQGLDVRRTQSRRALGAVRVSEERSADDRASGTAPIPGEPGAVQRARPVRQGGWGHPPWRCALPLPYGRPTDGTSVPCRTTVPDGAATASPEAGWCNGGPRLVMPSYQPNGGSRSSGLTREPVGMPRRAAWVPYTCAPRGAETAWEAPPRRGTRQRMSWWSVASGGCPPEVQERRLKGPGERRGRPSSSRASLRHPRLSQRRDATPTGHCPPPSRPGTMGS